MRPLFALWTVAFILNACSPVYELKVTEKRGEIWFEPIGDRGSGCLATLTVTSETGDTIWAIEDRSTAFTPCQIDRFPIHFGVTPSGMSEVVAPKTLESGVYYRIEATDGQVYLGGFRNRFGTIVNARR